MIILIIFCVQVTNFHILPYFFKCVLILERKRERTRGHGHKGGAGRGRGRERTPSRRPAECRAHHGVHPVTPTSQPESKPKVSLLTDGTTRASFIHRVKLSRSRKRVYCNCRICKGKNKGILFLLPSLGIKHCLFFLPLPCVCVSIQLRHLGDKV